MYRAAVYGSDAGTAKGVPRLSAQVVRMAPVWRDRRCWELCGLTSITEEHEGRGGLRSYLGIS